MSVGNWIKWIVIRFDKMKSAQWNINKNLYVTADIFWALECQVNVDLEVPAKRYQLWPVPLF